MMNRRTFLGVAAGIAGLAAAPPTETLPIIDTHIHLFDPRRPQGVPWPDKNNATLYKPALPDRYREVTKGLGVVGETGRIIEAVISGYAAAAPLLGRLRYLRCATRHFATLRTATCSEQFVRPSN